MESILDKLIHDNPHITFTESDAHSWSPKLRRITYYLNHSEESLWATFHEVGHALLQHETYHTDMTLLRMEVAAWQKAISLAKKHAIEIPDEHVQSCLDTYRDWLHKRSICPACERHGIQHSSTCLYQCFNCNTTWQVSAERFCRPYRLMEIK